MSVMEREDPPRRARRKFTDEFKRDAVALVIDEDRKIVMSPRVSGSVRARWGTGCARPASIGANGPGSAPASARSW